jgi:predicted nucleotidyltransferase
VVGDVSVMQISKKKISRSEREKIIEAISLFFQQQKKIVAVYLFGSFPSEKAFSDIDLGILFEGDVKNPLDTEVELETQIQRVVKYPVDARILNRAPLSFCQRVIRSGTLILDRSPNVRADFQGRVLKQYFDFSYFQKRYLREVVNAPI